MSKKKTIFQAAQSNDLEALTDSVVRQKVNVNLRSSDESTALHFAVLGQHEQAVRLLLNHNASSNVKNQRGLTPLHMAASTGNSVILLLLLEKSADPRCKDNSV
jgi:ankyrin repeat protein